MKIKYLLLLPFALLIAGGCMKTNNDDTPKPVPTGTFTGKFLQLRKKATGTGYDSVKADLTLTLNTTTGFTITGDTTQHAGSLGNYALDASYIAFDDKTKPSSKIHLKGYYLYGYDGTNLQLQQTFADTLGLFYILKKN